MHLFLCVRVCIRVCVCVCLFDFYVCVCVCFAKHISKEDKIIVVGMEVRVDQRRGQTLFVSFFLSCNISFSFSFLQQSLRSCFS